MNKHLILFFIVIPFSLVAMDQPTILRRIAISAEKKDVNNDLTFEQATAAVTNEILPRDSKIRIMAFARTYLRQEKSTNYKEILQELDCYKSSAMEEDERIKARVIPFIDLLKKVIDNWDTATPENIFKYVDESNKEHVINFLTYSHCLGLQDLRKDKRQ